MHRETHHHARYGEASDLPAAHGAAGGMVAATPHAKRLQFGSSGLAGALGAILFYSIDRTRAAITEPGYDPMMIIGSTRIDYFWRAGLGMFLATLIAAAVFWFAFGREEQSFRFLSRAVIPAVLFATLLSVLFP